MKKHVLTLILFLATPSGDGYTPRTQQVRLRGAYPSPGGSAADDPTKDSLTI